MWEKRINLSSDLKKLQDEGYEIYIINTYAIVNNVPYVNQNREVRFGTLVSNLHLNGDQTINPDTHVMYFQGETPCDFNGVVLNQIIINSQIPPFPDGVYANHTFSSRPTQGYADYYDKFTTYIRILSSHARGIDQNVTAKTYKKIESVINSVFHYQDTNSGKSNIVPITMKLHNQKISIIGVGGTGSYILDLVAKCPVREIHLYDDDDFLQHNAFRSPGAPSINTFDNANRKPKVEYFAEIYSNMHKTVVPHKEKIHAGNIHEILSSDFVFITIDKNEIKNEIHPKLIEHNVPFVDVGIDVSVVGHSLRGLVRVTSSVPNKNDHIKRRITTKDNENEEYDSNIQIAELNALNATLAVIKWKKYFDFYHDYFQACHTSYTIDTGNILNAEWADGE